MANPVPFKEPYTIVDGIKGRGHYVGTYLGHAAFSRGWWGEGEVKFYLDGDTDYPTINGTGEEDYFLGSYGYIKRHQNGIPYEANFSSDYAGFYATRKHTIEEYMSDSSERRYGQYRWHIVDPVRFDSDLKITIQNLGWEYEGARGTGHFLPLQDHLASVAYWYQSEPHQPFPELPPPGELRLETQKSITPNRNRPEFVELYNAYNSTADIVMLGDSLTHLANWNELLPEQSILNRGIAGDRTSDVLARLKAIRKAKAEYIFLMIGINDLYQNVDIKTVRQNIGKIVDELTAFDTTRRVFLQSTLPCNATMNVACSPVLPLVTDLNSFLAEFADSHDRVEFLDLVDLLSDEKQMLSSAYTYDGLHLNSAAYEIWVKEINKVLDEETE
jgi:lysophospholipase L1-like esterase